MRRWAATVLVAVSFCASAADWPVAGGNAAHTSSIDTPLPAELERHWTIDLPPLPVAWPDQVRLTDDGVYHPIVSRGRMIVTSPLDDSVSAYDVTDGRLIWRFFAQGPIRASAAADDQGRVFVGSDDGYLYALDGGSGKMIWRLKAAHTRLVLGNNRLIDTWAVRGGPVVADGRVYFAGGVWPFMGVFLNCADAASGKVIWTNSGDGAAFVTQPHGDPSFAGIAPQGSLAVVGDRLLVPNGRSVPAVYDRKTGKLLQLNLNYKFGGDRIAANKDFYLAGDVIFKLSDGKPVMFVPPGAVMFGERAYAATEDGLATFNIDRLTAEGPKKVFNLTRVEMTVSPVARGGGEIIRAGGRLYVGGNGFVSAVDLPHNPESPDEVWTIKVEGKVVDLISAEDRLLVVTDRHRIYCFGAEGTAPAEALRSEESVTAPVGVAPEWVRELPRAGWCLALGQATEPAVRELIGQTRLDVVILEPDAAAAAALRERLAHENLYGRRVAVMTGNVADAHLPPYFASAVVAVDSACLSEGSDWCAAVYRSLHPYRGVAILPRTDGVRRQVDDFAGRNVKNASTSQAGEMIKLARVGGPPGAGNWTHEHADASNTRVSKDSLIKAPLGVLWFGGTNHEGTLPRHGHGPGPQVCDGRLILEGVDSIRATDIYTGRPLWETPMRGIGSFFDNTAHQAGANGTGSTFVSTPDGVYVATEQSCVWLDIDTGAKRAEFPLPRGLRLRGGGADALWGCINVEGDYLVGSVAPRAKVAVAKEKTQTKVDPFEDPEHKPAKPVITNARTAVSQVLFVLDRRTGRLIWSVEAAHEFRHNAVCIGGGKLFTIDREPTSTTTLAKLEKALGRDTTPGAVRAFDLATGRELWQATDRIFGTFLSYSAEYDVLMESGRKAHDTLKDEPVGMRAYSGARGGVLWYDPKAAGMAMIRGREVMKESSAADLRTGAPVVRQDPLTGAMNEWTWVRLYGCNTPAVSENLITFRSGAAGYYDLARCGGTGNFGGFRSGCTNNLIVAGGVLSAPDYTRTCTCAYPLQTSLAMISDPEAEMWTYAGVSPEIKSKVRRVGINFGAPGDRVDDEGTPWLEYPGVGGKSPVVKVSVTGDGVEYFRRHATTVEGPLAWIGASGVKNAKAVAVQVDTPGAEARLYTVRLYFCQPKDIAATPIDAWLQGQRVETALDVIAAAGGTDRVLVREYSHVEAGEQLSVELKPAGKKGGVTVLNGIEIVAEE